MKNFLLLEEACQRNNLPCPVITMEAPSKILEELVFSVTVSCDRFSRSAAKSGEYPPASDIDEMASAIYIDMRNSGSFKID